MRQDRSGRLPLRRGRAGRDGKELGRDPALAAGPSELSSHHDVRATASRPNGEAKTCTRSGPELCLDLQFQVLVTFMRKKLTMEAGNFAPYGRLQQELVRPPAEPSTRAEKEPRRFPSEQVDPRGKGSPKDSQQLSALRSEFGSLLEDLYHGSRDPAMGQVLLVSFWMLVK